MPLSTILSGLAILSVASTPLSRPAVFDAAAFWAVGHGA